ncbi:thioredoxin domain-containing protein [Streptomyces antibioticus]|uniref:thioredoxin domain-containing protein n=1 Tax=Streptomyces antibioticus TaxID=1890 RepID=UPI0037127B62
MKIGRTVRAVVAVGLVGAFVGCGQRGSGDPSAGSETKSYASAERLPEEPASDGTTIVVGNPDAPSTVHVYEDPRCPVVEEYERTGAEAVRELLLTGEVKAQYTFASFKDDRLGGDGSKRAVNALRAALEKDKFVEYHTVLFANQPAVESSGGFTTARLLKLAEEVPGLRDEAFDRAVRTMKYSSFVTASEEAYEQAGAGTPTVVVNYYHTIEGGLYGFLFDASAFHGLLTDLHEHPDTWDSLYLPLKKVAEAEIAES